MKISVLIPTHNRPQLFQRCIQSVFAAHNHYPVDLEILVNNDSNDIEEVYMEGISVNYSYLQTDNLGTIYKLLYDSASKEYVYYLEDDDIMSVNFFEVLDKHNADIFYFNYTPYKVTRNFIQFFNYTKYYADNTKEEFLENYDDFNFQFSQICFKKTSLPSGTFPETNYIKNDFIIFKLLTGSFQAIDAYLYKQTIDGKDNISFKNYNKDTRWIL